MQMDNLKLTIMENFKAQAFLTMSNLGGISIMLNESGDAVRYQWYEKSLHAGVKSIILKMVLLTL